MSVSYSTQNINGVLGATSLAGVASFGSVITLAGVGTGATAADLIYEFPFISGPGTVRAFICHIAVAPTAVAPILKFWRRPVAGVSIENACVAMTPATMTIPLTSPTVIVGNVYRTVFTAGNEFAMGESFAVEADTVDSGAAATIFCGIIGSIDVMPGTEQTGSGVAKAPTSSVGRIYTLTS